ncbi:MAG: hypothetical protein ACUVUC_09435 [Thermoguttaceae bacterium]
MNRRDFLAGGLGTMAVAASAHQIAEKAPLRGEARVPEPIQTAVSSPRDTRLNIKPVMTNILHSGAWEGPCRWSALSAPEERANAQASFARWSKELKTSPLAQAEGVNVLEPAHLTFSEDFVLKPEQLAKLAADSTVTDAYFVYPAGSSIAAFEIAKRFGKPILLVGLGCRNVDIAAYTRSMGQEAFVAADQAELLSTVSLLRARKVFTQTRVLFPTDRGLPAVCSVGSVWDLRGLQERLKVAVRQIPYKELAEEMDRIMADRGAAEEADKAAAELLRKAERSYLDRRFVVRSLQFYQAVSALMARHACNAFTIECFEFCSSRLPEKWTITPCLLHALFGNQQIASSCEADLGTLLAMRMLMSVSGKSCHQGNSDPAGPEAFKINHSAPSMKMNGFQQPDLPYQLGRFVAAGWGTKVVVDFMNNPEKTVTVARVDPTGTRVLVLRGRLVGASGWGRDLLGCSVEAVIQPPQGRIEEFMKKRLQYGNHLPWVYGDYAEPMRQLGQMLKLEVELIS